MSDPERPPRRPQRDRGGRTRDALLRAGREVFAERGWTAATAADVAARAGVSYGTFYTWFADKQTLFAEIAGAVRDEMLAPDPAAERRGDRVERLAVNHRRYLERYRDRAPLIAALEHAAAVDPAMADVRREMRDGFSLPLQRLFARLEADRVLPSGIDPWHTAQLLDAMVDRAAYLLFVLEAPLELDATVRQLTLIWARALGLDVGPYLATHP